MARKKRAQTPVAEMESRPKRERHSVNIRQIKNGYIMSRSGPGIGKNEWDDEETYHAKKPKVQVVVNSPRQKAARKARLSKVAL